MTVYSMDLYQELAGRTINKDLSNNDLMMHAALGACSEAGEVAGLFQKVYQGHPLEDEHLAKEIGDLLWFVAELCTAIGYNMNDIADMNIEKLIARYPEGFKAEQSLHRKAGDI